MTNKNVIQNLITSLLETKSEMEIKICEIKYIENKEIKYINE